MKCNGLHKSTAPANTPNPYHTWKVDIIEAGGTLWHAQAS